jgi:hypothetical protein
MSSITPSTLRTATEDKWRTGISLPRQCQSMCRGARYSRPQRVSRGLADRRKACDGCTCLHQLGPFLHFPYARGETRRRLAQDPVSLLQRSRHGLLIVLLGQWSLFVALLSHVVVLVELLDDEHVLGAVAVGQFLQRRNNALVDLEPRLVSINIERILSANTYMMENWLVETLITLTPLAALRMPRMWSSRPPCFWVAPR